VSGPECIKCLAETGASVVTLLWQMQFGVPETSGLVVPGALGPGLVAKWINPSPTHVGHNTRQMT
jgi:hypothetical protein